MLDVNTPLYIYNLFCLKNKLYLRQNKLFTVTRFLQDRLFKGGDIQMLRYSVPPTNQNSPKINYFGGSLAATNIYIPLVGIPGMPDLLASPTFTILFKARRPQGIAIEQQHRRLNVTSLKTHVWATRRGVTCWWPDANVELLLYPFLYDPGYLHEGVLDFKNLCNILNADLLNYVQNI